MGQLDAVLVPLCEETQTAGWADYNITIGSMQYRTEILYLCVTDQGGIAQHASNYLILTVVRVAAVGGAETVIATLSTITTTGTALAAGVPLVLTRSEASNQHVIPAGDYLRLKFDANGTAPALTKLVVGCRSMQTHAGSNTN